MLHSLSYITNVYRHPEVFFKKGILRITFTNPCKSVTSTVFCKYATHIQQKAFFREHIWRTASVYHSKYKGYKYRGSL